GIDRLITDKANALKMTSCVMSEELLREREEINEQIRALKELKQMAARHGFDISEPASNAIEAFQWLYFGYLAAIKEQNGAAM
ncbi:formate acetyltransferase, partial [Pseudomonas sp. GP01-A3]